MNTNKSNVTWKKTVIYLICAALVIFYLLILWWGQNPNVGREYRMYYITNELADWPGYDNLAYEPGTVEYCKRYRDREYSQLAYKVCRRKGQGWQKNIDGSCVNKSEEAYIYYVPTVNIEQGEFQITVNHFEGHGNTAVYANDVLIGTITGTGDYIFKLHNIVASENELLTIKFAAAECEFGWWKVSLE